MRQRGLAMRSDIEEFLCSQELQGSMTAHLRHELNRKFYALAPQGYTAAIVPPGCKVALVREGQLSLAIPQEWADRVIKLAAYIDKETDLAATMQTGIGDALRLALLRGLTQLEAEAEAASANAGIREVS